MTDQAEFLEELARAIRLAHQRIDSLAGAELEKLLGMGGPLGMGPAGLGGVPSGLTGVAQPLGNAAAFVAQVSTGTLPLIHFGAPYVGEADQIITLAPTEALLFPVFLPGAMKLSRISYRVAGAATVDTEWVVCSDTGLGAEVTVVARHIEFFLAGAMGWRTTTLSAAVPLPAGNYWTILRNASATASFDVGSFLSDNDGLGARGSRKATLASTLPAVGENIVIDYTTWATATGYHIRGALHGFVLDIDELF